MTPTKLSGLIAATYTPMHRDDRINLDQVGPLVEHLIKNGINGLHVCGSTGEGMAFSNDERNEVALPARPGNLLVHHALTIHRANGNRLGNRTRLALGFIYYSKAAQACGISTCFVVGYVASLATSQSARDLTGLTVYTLHIPIPETKPSNE